MGAVYLAEHPGIGRRVAVKVLHKNYTRDENLLGRFLNEARAANAIRHPNIIEILDSGKQADGTPFLVMELLEGESLAARIRSRGAMPIPTALEFAYQTASALGAAHKKGIVHRDLKPDNLFVVPDPHDPDRERVKVLDFGIAKLQQSPADSVKTRTGTLMGTPIYMSPEQCRGTKAVDHRSDIYSLGIILYEMLLGLPPFVSEGFGELVNMHLNVQPPDLAKTHAGQSMSGSNPKLRDTTFSTGVGERIAAPEAGFGGKGKYAVVGLLAAAGVAAFLVLGRGGKPDQPPAVAVAPPPKPAPTADPPPKLAQPPAPVKVTVRLVSAPSGATVVNDADRAALGVTPLALTRPKGGVLKLRLEKDGYAPGARTVSLDTDQTLELTLTQKEKPKPRPAKKPPREPRENDSPAKL